MTLCNTFAFQQKPFLLYVSYAGGAMSEDVAQAESVLVAGRPARCAAVGLLQLCRKHAGEPLLVFNAELGVVLTLLKQLHLIRNPIVYRESTAVLSHCSRFWQWVIGRMVSRVDGIIVQSNETLKDLKALSRVRQPVAVIRNPCDWVEQPPEDAFTPVRVLPETPVRLLVVGRLESMKGHVRLLRALSRLTAFDWRLKIVGGGSMARELLAEVHHLGLSSRVELAGYLKDTRPEYEHADLVVISSYYEGLPNVLIEALACGCPVLAAGGHGGTTEFMRDLGLDDYIVEGDFESGFAAGVERVIESDRSTWRHAYDRLVAQVHPETVANKFWDFLTKVSQSSEESRCAGYANSTDCS